MGVASCMNSPLPPYSTILTFAQVEVEISSFIKEFAIPHGHQNLKLLGKASN
jgi:hypothetical protein